jgi:hypothetical protein
MNRSDFINMLEDKVQVSRQMIGEVTELIDIFPYFQSAHLLLLKGLRNNADLKFEKQLRTSAIHIADREVLYYLLNKKPAVVQESQENISHKTPDEEIVTDHQQTVIESAKNSEQLINEIERDSESMPKQETEASDSLNSHSILVSLETENAESEEVIQVSDEETASEDDRVFYMDPGFSFPVYNDLLELDTEPASAEAVIEDVFLSEQQEADAERIKKIKQSELIDKFILANPRIEPIRDISKLSSEDISKPFVEREGHFVTETLARIYINQGYYSKAIDIYEQLSLKFPEKSSYFATQIELVKAYLKK